MWLLMHPISNCFSFTSFFACGVSVTLLKAVIDEQRKITARFLIYWNLVSETVFKKVSRKKTFFNQSNDRKFENCLFAQ